MGTNYKLLGRKSKDAMPAVTQNLLDNTNTEAEEIEATISALFHQKKYKARPNIGYIFIFYSQERFTICQIVYTRDNSIISCVKF